MRKTSKQTTNTTGAAAQAASPAVAHEQFPAPPVIDNCETSSWPWSPEDFSPIEWWRSLPADHLGDAHHLLLRATLHKICVMNGREWLSAMSGDAVASIAIAVEMFPITEITLEVDLAMTVLMLGALDGTAAAAVILSAAPRPGAAGPSLRQGIVGVLAGAEPPPRARRFEAAR